jgi:hypothetical protein
MILDFFTNGMRDVKRAWNGERGALLGLMGYPRRFIVWIRDFGGCAGRYCFFISRAFQLTFE